MNAGDLRKTATAAAAIATMLLAGLPSGAGAASVGNLREIRPLPAEAGQGSRWELQTDARVKLQIGLLRPDLLRIWAGSRQTLQGAGDQAAPIVLPQSYGPVPFTLDERPDHLLLKTSALALRIYRKPLRFELDRLDGAGQAQPLWRELQPLDLAAERSVQTLSSEAAERFFGGGQQNGRYEFKGRQLEVSYSGGWEEGHRPSPAPFLMSSRGWGMLRNTWSDGSYDLRQPEQLALEHREGRFDAYYFVGPSLREVLARYTELTGRARLLPRWALEYGDADCYNDGDNAKKPGTVPKGWSDGPTGKTPDVIESVAKKYREHDMPGGWILPNDGYGCGYTELPAVVQGLREQGFRTGLWTENGVDKIAWEVGQAGSRAQKLDVAWTGKGYQFAMDANKSAYDGILNNSDARPFLWTVMGWAGIQRYAVTWTGDQSASWDYIRWHVPTLIGSGLSGQAYATGDVDAIFGGSAETYTRDLQWKSFTPVLMGMSGWAAAARKHPWWFDEPYRSINRRYLKLKLRLTPYMYGLTREAEQSGAPPVRGLMWDHPNDPQAYTEMHKYQFLLGRELLVAPVYRSQAASQGWRQGIHLPQGRWIDYWDGRQLSAGAAGRQIDLQVGLDKLPVFVRAGAILPMYPEMLYDGHKPKDELTLDLYPQGESSYTLYEDDGETRQYAVGQFSEQPIRMSAPGAAGGELRVAIGAVAGSYAGQEPRRRYALRLLSRQRPQGVALQGQALPELRERAAFDAAAQGWFFDPSDRLGTVHVKTAARDIREPLDFALRLAAAAAPEDAFPAAPAVGRELQADALSVVNRPAEEPGHPLEQAFDAQPETWFRTTRNQALKHGAHEWTLGFGERRLIDGIEIAPRTDQHWKHGQVRDYEVYMADSNGDWGAAIHRGRLALQQEPQQIAFRPTAGRLLRFRVLSTHNPDAQSAAAEAPAEPGARALDASLPAEVGPITLSRFRVLEHRSAERPELLRYLSDLSAPPRGVARDLAPGAKAPMRMNGLLFRKGLGVGASSRIELALDGDWRLLRADLGVDDSCRAQGGLQFQVWGDGRLLYDSGLVKAPGVVKPEIDVRGLRRLSLRTLGATGAKPAAVCGNWANAALLGMEGDRAAFSTKP
ncbi:TIM-barrel domain-containing protein [Roseateles sp. DAIF2]|uniref:TIM-barrel domain-containing protein n=1 Tax=Roseateles sp. DAIF2 TaxID=2714952 RepID=UPI00201D42A4|nr:TIM-barrel domain-containing protein [Roseateles sp. DAIF2]